MKRTLLLALLLSAQVAYAVESNPLGTVINLMDGLTAKITAQGEAESKAYKEYVEWCDDAAANVKFEIKTATSKKEELEATIAKTTTDAAASASQIEDLAAAITADGTELKEATAVRKRESDDFAASEAELVESVDILGRAINIIERESAKNPALMQQVNSGDMGKLMESLKVVVTAAAFSTSDRSHLMALVQDKQGNDEDDSELGAPAAAGYKSHSGNIVDILEDLKEKAEEELAELRKAEAATKHNYQMLRQSLEDQMAADTKDLDQSKSAKAASEEAKATATGDLAETNKFLDNSANVLKTTGTTCMTVAADHEATMKSRAEELAAIANAKKLLTENTSEASGQTYSFFQLVQTTETGSSLRTRADLANAEIVNLVKKLARDQHSATLAQLASRIAAVIKYGSSTGEDPFEKVKALISDMIGKLSKEAESEATEKSYCDEEMAKTKDKKEELNSVVSKLTSKIDKAAAKSASLKESVKTLQSELAKLAKSQSEMDSMRREQNADYRVAKQDLEQGLSGVRKALGVLRDYYASDSGAASSALLQDGDIATSMKQPAPPVKHSKSGGAGGSIMDILEVVESDFAKNLATEETQEADAAREYERISQENKVTKTIKEQDVKYETREFKALDKEVAEVSSDRETSNTELTAVMDYNKQIRGRCIAQPEAYEERKKRREAEITGLKEALSILNGEALVQRKKRGFHGHFLGA
jgi:hypothetical protein